MTITVTTRGQAPKTGSKDVTLRVGEFIGKDGTSYPTIEFQRGNARPFTLGVTKCLLILECANEIKQIANGKMNHAPSDMVRAQREQAQASAAFSSPNDDLTREQVAQYLVSAFQVSMIDALSMADDKRAITAARDWYAKQRVNPPSDKLGALLETQSHVPATADKNTPKKSKGARKTSIEIVDAEQKAEQKETNTRAFPSGAVTLAIVVNGRKVSMKQSALNKKQFVETIADKFNGQVLESTKGTTRTIVKETDNNPIGISHRFDSLYDGGYIEVRAQ